MIKNYKKVLQNDKKQKKKYYKKHKKYYKKCKILKLQNTKVAQNIAYYISSQKKIKTIVIPSYYRGGGGFF